MKISIRNNVFETNSSSVHSCSITTEQNYKDFCNGKVMIRQDWNDNDEYLPEDEAIERNIEYFKKELKGISEEKWDAFIKKYKETKDLWESFNAIDEDWCDLKYNLDYDNYFLNNDDYWDVHEYEEWSHEFTDSAGVRMVAWGYAGHD